VTTSAARYRAPRECPVCSERLRVTQLGCDSCGTGISGEFEQCEFCALDSADLDVLRVFLTSRGNMKELERHLGVSYPTARARYDEMVRKLGLNAVASAEPEPGRSGAGTAQPIHPAADPGNAGRLATLQALADGQLDIEQARRLITEG
jgi:hypothetical protein